MDDLSQESPLAAGFYNTPEQRKPIELKVDGVIPEWVSGSLYRGAGGTYDVGSYTTEHWFDGFSRVNRFEISHGKVTYSNRNLTHELITFVEETGRYPGTAFSQDPCKMIFGAMETTFRDGVSMKSMASARNVGVDWVRNWPGIGSANTSKGSTASLVATTDANELLSLDPETLEPLESFSYQKYNEALNSEGLSAAHPHHGTNGSLYNYVLLPTPDGGAEFKVFEVDNSGQSRILATISDAPASYIHEVFGTENYVVLIVWQAELDLETVGKTGTVMSGLKAFNKEKDALFYVIDKKKGGVISKYRTEAFFAFHAIAAFEDDTDGSIIIDLPWMKDWAFLEAARMENLRANVGRLDGNATHDLAGVFRRYRLPKVGDTTHPIQDAVVLFDLPHSTCNIELPKLNEAYRMKPYRFAYGIHVSRRGYFADSLVKIDVLERQSKIYRPEKDSICSEPIFVTAPNATSEDDGVLLSVVMDSSVRKSSLVVIDAKEMREVACARMPFVMGYGFHGTFAAA